MAKQIKILLNGKDTGVKGEYTKENGTVATVSKIVALFGANAKGLGDAVDIVTKGQAPATPAAPAPKRLAGVKIAVDPGHGGSNQNVSPVNKAYTEKAFNLKTAHELKKQLEGEGAEVFLTRTTDVNPTLAARADAINKFNPRLAVSIHTNAAGNVTQTTARGSEVIHSLHRPGDPLSAAVLDELVKELGTKKRRIYSRQYPNKPNTDYYAIIRQTNCHTILSEAAFHDNPEDLKILMAPDAHVKYARAVKNGIIKFLGK